MRCGLGPGLVLSAVVMVGACGGDDDPAEPDRLQLSDQAVIEYHYGDSSVPPEYHRSFTLTIRRDEVHVVVDSYGDVLQDTTVPLPEPVWSELTGADSIGTIADLDVEGGDDGCDGGTSRSLDVTDQGDAVVATELSVCGDLNGEAADRLDAYVQPVIDSIPDWERLVE